MSNEKLARAAYNFSWIAQTVHQAHHDKGDWRECQKGICGSMEHIFHELGYEEFGKGVTFTREPLSRTEELIWAQAFTQDFLKQQKLHQEGIDSDRPFESDLACAAAADVAWGVVYYARQAHQAVVDGFGADQDVTAYYRQMIGPHRKP